ncbi:iron-containing alcohol dehydrogenase, partial [Pseudomonas lundensis]|nr:iron-containing alcohol dehydrogenase [Pseudomonas lundensis]
GEFHISHGRANAVLLPHVVYYNAQKPSKFASFPKYEYHQAAEKYAKVARYLGLKAKTTEEGVENLIQEIITLMKKVNIPLSFKDCGIEEKIFEEKVYKIAENAFEDQCTPANPRMPLISEMEEILWKAYGRK